MDMPSYYIDPDWKPLQKDHWKLERTAPCRKCHYMEFLIFLINHRRLCEDCHLDEEIRMRGNA